MLAKLINMLGKETSREISANLAEMEALLCAVLYYLPVTSVYLILFKRVQMAWAICFFMPKNKHSAKAKK